MQGEMTQLYLGLGVQGPWLALDGLFLSSFAQMGLESSVASIACWVSDLTACVIVPSSALFMCLCYAVPQQEGPSHTPGKDAYHRSCGTHPLVRLHSIHGTQASNKYQTNDPHPHSKHLSLTSLLPSISLSSNSHTLPPLSLCPFLPPFPFPFPIKQHRACRIPCSSIHQQWDCHCSTGI